MAFESVFDALVFPGYSRLHLMTTQRYHKVHHEVCVFYTYRFHKNNRCSMGINSELSSLVFVVVVELLDMGEF